MGEPRQLILGAAVVAVALLAVAWPSPGDDGEQAPYGFACNPEFVESDQDGDGYKTPTDCDDADPNVHPGAAEICNLIDDNCNGLVDEFTVRTSPFAIIGRANRAPQRYDFDSSGDAEDPETMVDLAAGDEAAGVVLADLDLDGINEAVLQSADEGWVAAYAPDCEGGFVKQVLFDTVGAYRIRGVGDIDGDGDPDLVTLNTQTWMGGVWTNDGDAGFTKQSTEIDWGVIGDQMEAQAALADSQVLLDLGGDGFDDWLMCLGRYGKTYCYVSEGRPDGSMTTPTHLVTVTTVEANSATLGFFTQDDYPDLILGLNRVGPSQSASGENECKVYKLDGVAGGGFESSPDYLFDMALEVVGTAWGYDPDGVLDGWLRTVDMDRSDEGRSEILILLQAFKDDQSGMSLLYIKDPLDVDPSEGAQHKEIRPLVKELVDLTTSADPYRSSVVAGGFPVE